MRYLGNKTKLLEFIDSIIKKYNITGEVFADLFSGTSSVGDFYKDKYKIISNDLLYSNKIISSAKLKNKDVPKFKKFYKIYKLDIYDYLNSVIPIPNGNYFIFNNYSPKGGRMFFSEENAAKIDAIRIEIEDLYKEESINENEYNFLIASLLESVTRVSNTSGTYEAFFKFWESRALNSFKLLPIDINNTGSLNGCEIYQEDTNVLIRTISGDIAYLDPPYTVTQYISAYHMLETIAKYDYPTIKGVGGKRGRGNKNSLYSSKTKVLTEFEDLFRQLNFKHIILSYSNQGLIDVDELIDLASKFAKNKKVHIDYLDYTEYQNHRSSKKHKGSKLKEYIIYFEKDLAVNKSPLNYSGSKDKMIEEINRELPKRVEVFVDAMGGAFNVGANINALSEVVYNEYNNHVFEIISLINNTSKLELIEDVEKIIRHYSLEKGGKENYLKLREDYNLNQEPLKLFVLHMYSFQNMIRFNSNLNFNTPCGVAGYSEDLKNRILNFKPKANKVTLLNKNYKELDFFKYDKENTVFYFDPPYFITSASYNDGKRGYSGWSAKEESKLLSVLCNLDEAGYKFMLSNVIEHRGKKNHLLIEWANEHNFSINNVGKSGWRYAKNEVIIKNY